MESTVRIAAASWSLLESFGVAPEDLVGLSEIIEMLGVAKATAFKYTRRADFPEPLGHITAAGPVWLRRDVERWAKETLPLQTGRPRKESDG
jgi:predicted DNA-binding transcriptional regulator AlpA